MVNPPATQKAMSKLGLIYRLDWWPAIFDLYLDIYLYIFYGFWKFQSMFHLLFFFQFCWVESCSLVATNPTLSVPCEGCGHQSKSHRRKMQRRSVQRNQTVRVMWVSVVNSEITRFSVVQHVAFAVNNSKSHFCRNGSSSGYLHLLISLKKQASFCHGNGLLKSSLPSPCGETCSWLIARGIRFQPTITRNEFTRYFCSAIWNGFIHWGEWNNFISSICIFLREELYNSRSQTKTTSTGVFWRNFDHQLTENFTLFKNLVPSSHLLRWSKYHTGWIKSLNITSQDWFVQKSWVID